MGKRIKAIIKPELLMWARESSGYTLEIVARKANVKPEKLKDWEDGRSQPSIPQIRKLGNIYKRPIAVFYLPEKPEDFSPLRDFRRISIKTDFENNATLNFEMRRSYYRRDIALNLISDLNYPLPECEFKINSSDDPEIIGDRLRRFLNISFERQFSLSNNNDALNMWRSEIERKGILVFQASGIPVQEMSGFSISEFPFPIVTLNIRDSLTGRIFTLLHELAHILQQEGGICDIYGDSGRSENEQNFEAFCNHIAGATLVPIDNLLSLDIVKRNKKTKEWDDETLSKLAGIFKVSREVILRRLLISGKTTSLFYRKKREEFLREYDALDNTSNKGFAPLHRLVLSRTGLAYVQLVLDGYRREKITTSNLADYFDVKLKHIPKIESEFLKKSFRYGVAF